MLTYYYYFVFFPFSEFKLAMRKADAPGLRLATYRSASMPHLNVNSSSIRVSQSATYM